MAIRFDIVAETGSTNADLLARVRAGEAPDEGYWLRAEVQTAGRGRLGRDWASVEGNLHCSTAVILREDSSPVTTLSFVAGLALHDVIERCLLPQTPIMVKWPNDLLVRQAKIGGILLERQGDRVIIGFGVNVSSAPTIDGRQTTSLAYENGKFANGPGSVLDLLAPAFAARLEQWRVKPLSQTLLDWSVRSHRFGDELRVTGHDGAVIMGTYRGIDSNGALRLQPLGTPEMTIHAGDVLLGWQNEGEA